MKKLSQSLEDYLEAMYVISLTSKVARVKEVAKFLKVKTPSVVDAIGKLTEKDLVVHEKYGYLELTKKGMSRAKSIYRKHEELYKFFNEVLGMSPEISSRDACKIEHYISKETLDRMVKFIKFIETCPEGYPEWLKSFNYYVKHGKRPKSCKKKRARSH